MACVRTFRVRVARMLPLSTVALGACISIKPDLPDIPDTLPMTDFTLTLTLTDGFTQTSVPSEPTGDDTTETTDTTVGPTDPTTTTTDTTDPSTDPTDPPQDCGNGAVEGDEQCDDGNQSNEDACLQNCFAAFCGDGFVRAGVEQCDDANDIPDDGCDQCASIGCGNGQIDPGEDCDDGNASQTDACLNTCQVAFCGDSFVQAGVEACDDGNASNTDACPSCQIAVCGDGFLQSGVEDCDDGNTDPSDGCDNCQFDDLPPECEGIQVIDDATRNVGQSGPVECDEGLPAAGQWTRFTGGAGTQLPLTAPAPFACGTHAPGWLNGALPAVADGIVARDVCFHWEGNQCNWKVPISVRNCGPFVMFKLFPVPTCALRYCGVDG